MKDVVLLVQRCASAAVDAVSNALLVRIPNKEAKERQTKLNQAQLNKHGLRRRGDSTGGRQQKSRMLDAATHVQNESSLFIRRVLA